MPKIDWEQASTMVAGLVLGRRLGATAIDERNLMPPFNEVLHNFKAHGDTTKLIEEVGLDPVQACLSAAERINGTSKLADWVALLSRAKHSYEAGEKLERFAYRIQRGDDVDWAEISAIAERAQDGIGNGLTPLSAIDGMEVPFKKTGFLALDHHFGGIPEIGQIIVAASPGTGKTSFMIQLASCWVKEHPDEVVVIFTLEMMKEELKLRFKQLVNLTDDEMARILVEDAPMTPEETVSIAAGVENLGLVCVDFADLLIRGETTESSMAHIYRTYMLGAKNLHTPVVLLSQLSRTYNGGIPRPNNIRWTSLAEALAWGIFMLYNPNKNWFQEVNADSTLPPVKNHAYIIAWKLRGGFTSGAVNHESDSPGAVLVPFIGSKGWHYGREGTWYPLTKEV